MAEQIVAFEVVGSKYVVEGVFVRPELLVLLVYLLFEEGH
jgi:hypothetical protein